MPYLDSTFVLIIGAAVLAAAAGVLGALRHLHPLDC